MGLLATAVAPEDHFDAFANGRLADDVSHVALRPHVATLSRDALSRDDFFGSYVRDISAKDWIK